MTNRMMMLVGLVLAGLMQAVTAQMAQASPPLETIVAKHLEAQGGTARLKAIKSVTISSTDTYDGKTTTAVNTRMRPNLFRYEANDGTATMVKAFDGKVGWHSKDGAVEMIPADKVAMMKAKGFDDPLVDPAAANVKVELEGQEKLDGATAHVLKLTMPNGDVQRRYIDAQSYREVKRVATWTYEGKTGTKTVAFSDFKTIDGVTMAMKSSYEKDGKWGTYTVTKVELDAPVKTALFSPPAKATDKAAALPASTK